MCSLGNLESPPQQMFKKKTGFVSIREVDSTPRQKYLMVGIWGLRDFLILDTDRITNKGLLGWVGFISDMVYQWVI